MCTRGKVIPCLGMRQGQLAGEAAGAARRGRARKIQLVVDEQGRTGYDALGRGYAERYTERYIASNHMKKTWESEEEKRAARIDERNLRLDRAVPSRICPSCRRGPILESRSWVVYGATAAPMASCRSCWMKDKAQAAAAKVARLPLDKALIVAVQRTFVVSPVAVRSARERVNLSQQDMADECGWTRARQRAIETDETVLTEGELRELVAVLLSAGAKVWDSDLERVGIAAGALVQEPTGR